MSEKINNEDPKKGDNIIPMNALSTRGIQFENPLKNVYTANLPIAGCAWIETTEGVVLIDTLLAVGAGKEVFKRINGMIKYIIYTHGHGDLSLIHI